MANNRNDEENSSKDSNLAWFKQIHPDAKAEFPPQLNPKVSTIYILTFKEKKPRVVPDIFDQTGVIEVEYNGKIMSLFLGHTYLAQKIYELQKKHGSLMGIRITLHRLKKRKDYIEYEINEV
jgi:hypothetical protein